MIPRQQIENNLDILGLNFPASRDNLLTLKNLFVQIIADLGKPRSHLLEYWYRQRHAYCNFSKRGTRGYHLPKRNKQKTHTEWLVSQLTNTL